MYMLIKYKYIKSVLWRVAKCLSYIEEAHCLKVNLKRAYFDGVGLATVRILSISIRHYVQLVCPEGKQITVIYFFLFLILWTFLHLNLYIFVFYH